MIWFKFHANLKDHPKRWRFEEAAEVKHGLHYIAALWCYVTRFHPDGILAGVTHNEVAKACEWEGEPCVLWGAFVSAGFIEEPEGSPPFIHDWIEEHERFITENKRNPRLSQGTPKGHPRLSQVRIEENRIEEKREKPKPTPGAVAPGFEEFWQAYPKRVGKGACLKIWNKKKPPLQVCLDTLSWQKRSEQWAKDNGQFIPMPSTWLNQDRWLDEQESGRGTGRGDGYAPPKYDDF